MELEEQEQEGEMEVDEENDTTGQPLRAIQRDQTIGNLTEEFMKVLSDRKRFDSTLLKYAFQNNSPNGHFNCPLKLIESGYNLSRALYVVIYNDSVNSKT